MKYSNQNSLFLNAKFHKAVSSANLNCVKRLIKKGANVNSRNKETSTPIFVAYTKKLFDNVKFLLTQGADYRAVQTAGSLAGYSLLHIASEDGQEEIVKLLLTYNPDLTSRTPDGASPVHLAVLLKHRKVLQLLLAAGADIDAGFGRAFHNKYFGYYSWCCDFGEEITLLSHAVINNNDEMVKLLVDFGASVTQKSLTGKTLLMYAVERDNIKVVKLLLDKMAEEDVNSRDNCGATAVHFILHQNKFNQLRFNPFQTFLNSLKALILKELLEKNADINATINNDPQSLLINMAAFRGCPEMLKLLLVKQTSKLSKPLFYSSINPHFPESYSTQDPFFFFAHNVKKCVEQAVMDIVTKCEINLSVSKSEVELLEIFAQRSDSGDFVADCKNKTKQYLEELKSEVIYFGESKVSLFDILNSGFGRLRKFITNDDFMKKIRSFDCDCKFEYFYELALSRLDHAKTRVKLLKESNKVFVDMLTPFPLPYEVVREIVDFVDNEDLKCFNQAFK